MKKHLVGRFQDVLPQEQKREFSDEGASPRGVIRAELSAACPDGDLGTASFVATSDPAKPDSVASLIHRVRVAEAERDALSTLGQEELYLSACERVDALERQLEEGVSSAA